MTPNSIVSQFMIRLQEAEAQFKIEPLLALFHEQADMQNLTRQNTHSKESLILSPHAFWNQYLSVFEQIESNFTHVTDDGVTAVLEWSSRGLLPMGLPIEYSGVSIIEYENSLITKFRTYYDSAAFLRHSTFGNIYSQTTGTPKLTNEATS